MTRVISALADISKQYDAAFVDLWGCVHDGVTAHPAAVDALKAFRARGGTVVLLTNAPRPRGSVETQIAKMGVPDDAWDTIATSGDAARAAMFRGAVGEKVWFMGEAHDQSFFDPIGIVDDPVTIERVELEKAQGIVCCGPFDPHADPEEERGRLLWARERGLKLLCANPDIVVDRGGKREWCAGAIARLYTEMGGQSLYFGKPHPPIYDLARRRLTEIGAGDVSDAGILCIGDGAHTDIDGGMGEDLDTLFVSGGLAAAETETVSDPDPAKLKAYLASEAISPTYTIGHLR